MALPLGAAPAVDGVFVDGAGPFRFLVDTGAQSSSAGKAVTARLNSAPRFAVEVVTVAGSTVRPVWKVPVRVGSRGAHGELLEIETPGADGILGQSFLREFSYLISGDRFELAASEPGGGVAVPARLIDGRPAIRWNGAWLILDSGASHMVLFREGKGKRVQLSTHAGSREAALGEIGGQPVAYAGAQPGREEDGLLPANLFEWVYVARGGNVVLGPLRPSRVRRTGEDILFTDATRRLPPDRSPRRGRDVRRGRETDPGGEMPGMP